MGFTLNGALILVVDNTAAIDVAENEGVTARTKHFDICVHYFRDGVKYNKFIPIHTLTAYQRADGFTKGLDRAKHIAWTKMIYDLSFTPS